MEVFIVRRVIGHCFFFGDFFKWAFILQVLLCIIGPIPRLLPVTVCRFCRNAQIPIAIITLFECTVFTISILQGRLRRRKWSTMLPQFSTLPKTPAVGKWKGTHQPMTLGDQIRSIEKGWRTVSSRTSMLQMLITNEYWLCCDGSHFSSIKLRMRGFPSDCLSTFLWAPSTTNKS